MYEWVPFLHGTYYTYTEYAAGIFWTILAAIGALNLLISKILKCLAHEDPEFPKHLYQLGSVDGQFMRNGQYPLAYAQRPYFEPNGLSYLKDMGESSLLVSLSDFFNWVGWFFLSVTPIGFSTFGVLLSPGLAGLIMFLIHVYRLRRKYHAKVRKLHETLRHVNHDSYIQGILTARSAYKKGLLIYIVFSFALAFSFSGGCIAFYEEYVGLWIEPFSLSVSTSLIRYFQLTDACPPGPPCHIYATLPESASTAVFINIHTNVKHDNVVLWYDIKDYYDSNKSFRFSKSVTTLKLDSIEQRGKRSIHTALLDNLTPDTTYYVQVTYDGSIRADFDYVTLPDETGTRDIILASGGDLGDRNLARQVTSQAGNVNPDIMVIGGDVAYDDGEQNCYFTYDNFLRSFAQSTLVAGRLIPFLFSIGNHDVGLNPLSGRPVHFSEKGPLYGVFFPQNTASGVDATGKVINRVPALPDRRSYHYHVFGKIVHFNLDSGYVSNFEEQADLLNTVSSAFPNYIKLVSQHNPTYWSCSNDEGPVVQNTRNLWVPLFEKYRFMSIFENHEHSLKKTFPLINGTRDPNGIYYLGNGNWGAIPSTPTCENINNSTGVLEFVNRINHFWLVNVSVAEGLVSYTPLNSQGVALIPTFSQEIDQYVN